MKVWSSIACASKEDGGLSMIHVKNSVHYLRMKWMHCLCKDVGLSWLRYAWCEITGIIADQLFAGLRAVSEHVLQPLDPFYAVMLQSFAHVNNLFYTNQDASTLPKNLWCGEVYSHIDRHWCAASFFTSVDLPLVNGQIDVKCVTNRLKAVGWRGVCYLQCCAFQRAFALFEQWVVGMSILCDQVIIEAKALLQHSTVRVLSLDN